MDKKIFYPFKGVETIEFGMTREKIRALLGSDYITFLRNEFSENTSDYYKDLNMFVQYNKDNICNALEFAAYNYLIHEGRNLFDFSYKQLTDRYGILSKEKNIEDEVGVTYYDLGFGASKKMFVDEIESIIVFSKEYWKE